MAEERRGGRRRRLGQRLRPGPRLLRRGRRGDALRRASPPEDRSGPGPAGGPGRGGRGRRPPQARGQGLRHQRGQPGSCSEPAAIAGSEPTVATERSVASGRTWSSSSASWPPVDLAFAQRIRLARSGDAGVIAGVAPVEEAGPAHPRIGVDHDHGDPVEAPGACEPHLHGAAVALQRQLGDHRPGGLAAAPPDHREGGGDAGLPGRLDPQAPGRGAGGPAAAGRSCDRGPGCAWRRWSAGCPAARRRGRDPPQGRRWRCATRRGPSRSGRNRG